MSTEDRMATVAALAGRYSRLHGVVVDAWQVARERDADPLRVLLAQAGVPDEGKVPELTTDSLAASLRLAFADEMSVWRWLLETTPPALSGATPHETLRQGRVADVASVVWGSLGGTFL